MNEIKDAVNMYGLSYHAFAGKLTWSNVKTYIQNDYPFILGLMTTYQDDFGETIVKWHMVTGYGYECSYGDANTDVNQRYVNIWDPNGSHRTLRYNATTYSIDGYQWIWHETVADRGRYFMKRLLVVFFSAMLLLNMFGCAQKSGDPVNNEVFTDEFFEDVTAIRFGISHGPITGEQLAAVARYFKSLRLTHTEEELPYEHEPGHYGGRDIVRLDFIKRDGTSLSIRLSQWGMSGLPGGSYHVSDYNKAIERGEKSLLRSIWEACGNDADTYPLFS